MLLEFGLKNFFSFKEGVVISFKLDRNCPGSISNGRDFATVMCVKGANGSGKTHILRGLSFISTFCAESFSSKPDSALYFEPFFDSKAPSEFYIEFNVEEYLYRYELEATDQEVIRETLYRTKSKKIKIIERIGNQIQHCIKDFASLEAIKLRKNASLISTAHQYEFSELQDVYTFFSRFSTNVSYLGSREEPRDIGTIAAALKDNSKWSEIVIDQRDIGTGKKEYYPVFYHDVNEEKHLVMAALESSGTKTLFRELLFYKWILDVGGVMIIDEFGTNLHPHILPLLLNQFLDPEINTKNAQIVISTHDSSILDLLGRYRTYLVNKDNNESFAYRLDQIPGDILRNDRPISPTYNDGKIGGVPRL
jgi:hypothetical protein